MKVFLVTDQINKTKEWWVTKDEKTLWVKLEKMYGQDPIKIKVEPMSVDAAYFLKHQKNFDRVYEVKGGIKS